MRQPGRRSSLFLMEMIVAILFFSLTAAICVRIFVKSHTLEANSRKLNHAVNAASSVAEIFRSEENPLFFLSEQFPQGSAEESSYTIYYDEFWDVCALENASYTVVLETEFSDSFLVGNIDVQENEESIYQLDVKKYIAKEAFENEY